MSQLLISFSGGETSAYMTHWLLNQGGAKALGFDATRVVFANTGQENEQTLEFVRECDERFGFQTAWIEGVQFPGEKRAPGFRIVNYETADRAGGPFEAAIAKYGIPNTKFKDCTRNLKRKPIEAYARDHLGWALGTYYTAIGIRADELDRISSDKTRLLSYPLAFEHPRTKPQINYWWSHQDFRLRLKSYNGNCRWCWKKSLRKHLTIISERPEVYDFPRRMEAKYGLVGPEFLKDPATRTAPLPPGYHRTFFRGNLSTEDLFAEYERRKGKFEPAGDEAQVFDAELDVGSGCEESCEVFADEDELEGQP